MISFHMDYEANRRVETSARTFAIVERLSRTDRIGVSTLADELGMSKGIVHNHLSTLRELGYVNKLSDGYALSPGLLTIGLRARTNTGLYEFASGLAADLAQQHDIGVFCCQESGSECTVIDAHNVSRPDRIELGTTLPLTESLVGVVLCLASQREGAEVTSTEYDTDLIRDELSADDHATGPLSADIPAQCVAVPVLDESGDCIGSIGAVVPDGSTDQQRQAIRESMVSLRDTVERRLESGWTGERSFTTEKHEWVN